MPPREPKTRERLSRSSIKFNVKFIQLEKRVKLGGALRKGLAACSYSLVARFDTDDICEPHRFEKQLEYMASNPNIDVCGSYASIIDENGMIEDELKRPLFHKSILQIIWSCPIIHPSVMMRKDKILKVGSYKSLLFSNQEDYELWIRSANNGITAIINPTKYIEKNVTNYIFGRHDANSGGKSWRKYTTTHICTHFPLFNIRKNAY